MRRGIAFTNGAFDVLHAGHITLLNWIHENYSLCRLIVALNTDDSIRRLKGPGRPVNKLENRMLVVSHLDMVSCVCSFGEDTPARIIEVVRPDVLIKGGDYASMEIVGEKFVRSYGGTVIKGPYIEGISTTEILRKGSGDGNPRMD